jgi:hypothetical protein
MAAGKPIVASDMEELRPIAGPELAIARTDDEWVAAVEASLASDSAGRVSNRQQIAMANSWDSRVEEISELLARELAGRAPGPASQPLPASATVGGQ